MSSAEMLYTKLGKSDLEVSKIGFGTWKLIDRCDYLSACKLLKEAQTRGINFIDTSDNYPAAESWIGRAIKEGELSRDRLVLATKVGLPTHRYERDFEYDTSPQRIRNQVDKSIRNLCVDTIDLYQLHTYDEKVPISDVISTMSDLIDKKKIRHYGLSNFSLEKLEEVLRVCKDQGLIPPISLQNMLYIGMFDKNTIDAISRSRKEGMHVLAHSPLGRGFLTERNLATKDGEEYKNEIKAPFKKLIELAKIHNRNIEQLAIAWVLSFENSIPIVGAYKLEYLEDAIEAVGWKLDEETQNKINEVREDAVIVSEKIASELAYKILTHYTLGD